MGTMHLPNFERHCLFDRFPFFVGRLPDDLDAMARTEFEPLWVLHPKKSNTILMHGRSVEIPRWQQAYGRNYHFSGTVSRALPVPQLLKPFLEWVQNTVDARLNGLLLNWKSSNLAPSRSAQFGIVREPQRFSL